MRIFHVYLTAFPVSMVSAFPSFRTDFILPDLLRLRCVCTCARKCYITVFHSIRSQLAKFRRFLWNRRECPRLESKTFRAVVACSIDCAIAIWESAFLIMSIEWKNIALKYSVCYLYSVCASFAKNSFASAEQTLDWVCLVILKVSVTSVVVVWKEFHDLQFSVKYYIY